MNQKSSVVQILNSVPQVLTSDKLRTLLQQTLGTRDRFNDIVSLLAFTGQRRGEIADLMWSEIDGDRLVLPPARTKNRREHIVPLAPRATALLETIQGGSQYVFGTAESDSPFSGWSRAGRRLVQDTGLAHFTLHDLRRTFSTIHATIGTPIHVTERLLNHVSGTISGVAAVYNRHSYWEEMQSAMQRYDEYLGKTLGNCYAGTTRVLS